MRAARKGFWGIAATGSLRWVNIVDSWCFVVREGCRGRPL